MICRALVARESNLIINLPSVLALAGAAASLPRVDEGEREARAIYQQLKAREASGDLKVSARY